MNSLGLSSLTLVLSSREGIALGVRRYALPNTMYRVVVVIKLLGGQQEAYL